MKERNNNSMRSYLFVFEDVVHGGPEIKAVADRADPEQPVLGSPVGG